MSSQAAENRPAVCSATSVVKSFGRTPVLRSCSFSIGEAERILLLGRNGAGKSTLLKVLAGVLTPESGSVSRMPGGNAYLSQDMQFYGALSVAENLAFFAALRGQTIQTDIAFWGLTPFQSTPFNHLSKGLQQRVNLCRVFMDSAPLLLLDEPTTHLDAEGIDLFIRSLERFLAENQKRSVVIASHDIATIEPVVNRAVVLQNGSVAVDSQVSVEGVPAAIAAYRMVNR